MSVLKRIHVFIVMLVLIASCTSYKDITYLRNLNPAAGDSLYKVKTEYYKIQHADILYIRVNCLDENINDVFNKSLMSSSSTAILGGFYVVGYTVDQDGSITLPVLGKIQVAGYTISEALSAIQKLSDKYIANAQIELKLVSFKISVIGEVKKPGQITIFNDKANIFEALANAGDLTYYANRRKVLLLRTDPEGIKTYRIDLTDKNILASKLFYLQPNDVIYVEPLKSTGFRLSASEYSVLLSAISITLTTYILIRNLK